MTNIFLLIGYVVCNVELPALCSSKNFKTSHASSFSQSSLASASTEQSQAMLSQLMQEIIAESQCLKEEDLCIKEGFLAWVLYIDLICLNNDGNVQDACCLAMLSALRTVKLYEISYDEEENKPIVTYPLCYQQIKLHSEPICTTLFALEDKILLSDPNKQEEEFMRTFLIVCTLDDKKTCLIKKLGGTGLPSEQMSLCIERALKNGIHLRKTLSQLYIQNKTNN